MNWTTFKHGFVAHLPEILTGAGIILGVTSTVLAVKATPKAQKARKDNDELKAMMDESLATGITGPDEYDENGDQITTTYSEEDYKSDMRIYIGRKVVSEVKPYIPSIASGTAALVCILAAVGILKKRQAAAISLAASTASMFSTYRGRVVEDQGKEKDREYYTGVKRIKEKVEVVDAEGKEKKVTVEKDTQLDTSVGNCPFLSPYAVRITSENCRNFENMAGDPIYVAHWLETIQEMCNVHLHTDGILYLDWVLDNLGIKLDPESNPNLDKFIAHNVGWIDTDYYTDTMTKEIKTNDGDRYVDFGCWNENGELRLVRGKDGSVYLDFNVDGWINGRLPRKTPGHILEAVRNHPEIER